jgi:hypothetical protein
MAGFVDRIIDGIPWGDFGKGLVSIIFSTGGSFGVIYASPVATAFPSINPKIIQEIWSFNILMMLVASIISYILSARNSGHPRYWPGLVSGLVFVICLVILIVIPFISLSARAGAVVGRLSFIGLSASLSGVIAWALAWALNRADVTPSARA